jgi:DNA-3-methyladenine glycosylase I
MPKQVSRCPWVDPFKKDYLEYHDKEWGVPVHDDHRLFEFLTLEGAQAGLSWYTVLRKRENYRLAFAHFDPQQVARYDERQVAALLGNPGIIRGGIPGTAYLIGLSQRHRVDSLIFFLQVMRGTDAKTGCPLSLG